MPPVQAAQRVSNDEGRVGAPRWKERRAAEVEVAAGNADLRQSNGLSNPVADTEIDRVEFRIRLRSADDSIQTEPRLIDAIPSEGMRLVQGEELPAWELDVPESWNGVTARDGLDGL